MKIANYLTIGLHITPFQFVLTLKTVRTFFEKKLLPCQTLFNSQQ